MSIRALMTLVAGMVLALSFAPAANAQATRTWVSGVGDDANPCSRTSPCRTFEGAISKTAAGGEINTVDSGGFGAVTITKSISIIAAAGTGGVLVAGGNGIVVNTPAGGEVYIEGLDLEGMATSAQPSGPSGVRVLAGTVTIRRCSIRNFSGAGVEARSATGAVVFVDDVVVTGNGVGVKSGGAGFTGNAVYVTDSMITGNSGGVEVDGSLNSVILADNTMLGNAPDLSVLNGGRALSYGGNAMRSGAPTQTIGRK